MSSVGFIGLGCMGAHMVKHLIRNGVKLVIYDTNKAALQQFASPAVTVGTSAADVAAQCDRIITMLPEGTDVYGTFTQKKGVLETLKPQSVCFDSSTIDQKTSIQISQLVEQKKSSFLDAPVSGGVVGAENGTLTFMVGGKEESFQKVKPLFEFMGKNAVHCGKNGNGLAAKICNNMLLGVQMIGVAETMNLGVKMGLDAHTLAGIINTSTGRCWSSDTYNPVPGIIEGTPPSNNYEGGFRVSLINKDLGLAEASSTQVKAPIFMGALAHQIYQMLNKDPHYGTKDFGVIYKFLKDN